MEEQRTAITKEGSVFSRYQSVVVGRKSLQFLVFYEFCTILAVLPGALGLFLRKVFWRRLLGKCGEGVVFGANITLRNPDKIHLGERVIISEGCILDARNENENEVIKIADDVIFSNNVMISCKNGTVKIGPRTGISAQTIIHSTQGNPVNIGSDVIIGPKCYIVGGGNYYTDRLDIPMWQQGIKYDGGIILENDVWLGANVTVLGGVKMGFGSIAAAGAVVNSSIPERAICGGLPAKVLKTRSLAPGWKFELKKPHKRD